MFYSKVIFKGIRDRIVTIQREPLARYQGFDSKRFYEAYRISDLSIQCFWNVHLVHSHNQHEMEVLHQHGIVVSLYP